MRGSFIKSGNVLVRSGVCGGRLRYGIVHYMGIGAGMRGDGKTVLLIDKKLPAHVLCVGVKNALGTIIVRDPDRRTDAAR